MIRLVQKSLVLRGVVTELRPAIPVPDRANTVAGSSEAMTSGRNPTAVAQFRGEGGRHPVFGRFVRVAHKLDISDDSLYGWTVEVLLRH